MQEKLTEIALNFADAGEQALFLWRRRKGIGDG